MTGEENIDPKPLENEQSRRFLTRPSVSDSARTQTSSPSVVRCAQNPISNAVAHLTSTCIPPTKHCLIVLAFGGRDETTVDNCRVRHLVEHLVGTYTPGGSTENNQCTKYVGNVVLSPIARTKIACHPYRLKHVVGAACLHLPLGVVDSKEDQHKSPSSPTDGHDRPRWYVVVSSGPHSSHTLARTRVRNAIEPSVSCLFLSRQTLAMQIGENTAVD